ncbi:hypothetical protein JJB09_07535 [Rhizobium sp. KVB221]|uniref:Tetratricopeptide repeat protein n=1 Tax=Rhizobium setariae TaxID=2801340 RepID=A0A936YK70_9HYPH|nr:hypothetical protein [Rhizobium setariae]MBL0371879.1 hypothetical protein [Rhizobium setariae]
MDENRYPDMSRTEEKAPVEERAARDELERLFSDPRLRLTERNYAFLGYIAEKAFAGNTKGAKAYSIAVDVFGRPPSFDPAIDPIVRIEAARLRAALDQYYDAYGAPNGIRVGLPRGHYIADFTHIPHEAAQGPAAAAVSQQAPLIIERGDLHDAADNQQPKSPRRVPKPLLFLVTTLVAALTLVSAAAFFVTPETHVTGRAVDKPLVSLVVQTRDPAYSVRADNLKDDLMVALARFGTLRLAKSQSFARHRSGTAMAGVDRDTFVSPSDYQIALTYRVDSDAHRVTWSVIEPGSGETLFSGQDAVANPAGHADQADAKLVSLLGARFGSAMGQLNGLELHRKADSVEEGNVCVLGSEYAISAGTIAGLAQSRACLEATLKANKRDADANATLARVLVALDEVAGASSNSTAALGLANEALTLAPNSDRALAARMVALYAKGRLDAAFEAGNDALAANPLNAEVASAFALRLYVSGSWAKGAALARSTLASSEIDPPDAALVLALEAYRNGAFTTTLRQLDSIIGEDSTGSALRIATLVRMGRRADAFTALGEANHIHPHFLKLFSNIMTSRHADPSLLATLKRDIAEAGTKASAELRPAMDSNPQNLR